MVQVPGATRVNVVPLTVHTGVVLEANWTINPELVVAESADGVPTVWLPGEAKVMVCVCTTAKLWVTEGAAL